MIARAARAARAASAVAVVVVGGAAALVVAAAADGCGPSVCENNRDCPLGKDCGLQGECVPSGVARVTWISPADGSTVGDHFDVVVEVSFRGQGALLHVDRAKRTPGDACAPFVPKDIPVQGSAAGVIVQRVTIPDVAPLGETFTLFATLGSGTETAGLATLHGPKTPYGGATFDDPTGHTADASSELVLPVSVTFDRAATSAFLWTEPLVGVPEPVPTPKVLLGNGLATVTANAPLVRGPQIVWVETDGPNGPQRCGTGIEGLGAPKDATTGLGLGLTYEGGAPGQLFLRARADRAEPVVCSVAEPGAGCTPLFQTRGPALFGEEAVHLDTVDGDAVEVVVVPGAAGPPIRGTIRVSYNGQHIGFLGPMPLNPENGDVWIAGTITIAGALARIAEQDDVVVAPPF